MNRRSFLGLCLSYPLSMNPLINRIHKKKLFGWVPGNKTRKDTLYNLGNLRGFGSGKVACLWKSWNAVIKHPWVPHYQVVGDCVAHGSGGAMDVLTCTLIDIMKKRHKYVADSSTDMIYSGSRNQIGGGRLRGDGSQGEWAVKYLSKWGNLLRQQYPPYDLTPYSRETVRKWDRQGIPESLLEIAKEHPLLDYANVRTWEEIRDAVAGGKPVIICGGMGLNNDRRDDEGFVKPSGYWSHCMFIAGIQDGDRPGGCIVNSHGPGFGKGPKTHGQPDGSVWVDADNIIRYMDKNDTFAISNYQGFDAPEEDYILW